MAPKDDYDLKSFCVEMFLFFLLLVKEVIRSIGEWLPEPLLLCLLVVRSLRLALAGFIDTSRRVFPRWKVRTCPVCAERRSLPRGGCSSEGRAGCLVIRRLLGLNPGSPWLQVEVSLSKTLNPKLLPMSSWHLTW